MPDPETTVLVAGSLHYDIMVEADHLPRRDETAIGQRWFPKFGGKGGNQAVAVCTAGGSSRMLGAVGDDDFGRFLRQGLRNAGVDDTPVTTVPGTGSGMSVAILDRSGDYAATIVSGANLLISPASLENPDLWQGVGLLVLQNEVPETLNLTAATQARRRGIPTLLNAAPSRPMSPDLTAQVDILVVNAVEAEMMGTPPIASLTDAATAVHHLANHYQTVIVTAGALGLAARGPAFAPFVLEAEKVTVVSTHGAGDAFIGALAAKLVKGADIPTACAAASRAAAAHVAGHRPAITP